MYQFRTNIRSSCQFDVLLSEVDLSLVVNIYYIQDLYNGDRDLIFKSCKICNNSLTG